MNVALGAYLLSGTPGYRQAGIHQYIRNLVEALDARDEVATGRVKLTALVSKTAISELTLRNVQPGVEVIPTRRNTESPLARICVEQFETPGMLRTLKTDVYHGMAFVTPLRSSCPTVITVHDLSFITRPQTHKLLNRTYLSLLTRLSCRRAARIIAASERTRRDIVNLLRVDASRVDVIPHGVHPAFRPMPADVVEPFRVKHGISESSVFFLGSLEPRKNLPVLIEAFGAVLARVPAAELYVGGSPGWKYEPVFQRTDALGLKDKVHLIGQVPQDELPLWYNTCRVFAYPSLYEGFGMPVLEAMACGATVVTSNVTSLPEVVGDAGIMVSPDDIHGLADALAGVLSNLDLRLSMREKALRQAAKFTWDRCAGLTLESYQHTMDGST